MNEGAVISVKSSNVRAEHIRDLGQTAERQNAAIGVFNAPGNPSKNMVKEAVGKRFYHTAGWNKDYPKLQVSTT